MKVEDISKAAPQTEVAQGMVYLDNDGDLCVVVHDHDMCELRPVCLLHSPLMKSFTGDDIRRDIGEILAPGTEITLTV